jgi:monoamine oxidase
MFQRASDVSRREFLKQGLVLGTAMAGFGIPDLAKASAPRIVIVGGGLAGMTAAYRIWKRSGIRPVVYEAQTQLGGRTSTIRGLPGGQWSERGGQSISTSDRSIRKLMSEVGLQLIDTYADYPDGSIVFLFGGRNYSENQITRRLNQVYAAAERHFNEVKYPARYDNKNPRTIYWDEWSVAEWIDEFCPGGLNSPLGQLLKVNFESDYGGPVGSSSALHIIYDLAAPGGGYDERYIINGGSDSLVRRLSQLLPAGSVKTGMALEAMRKKQTGAVTCTFRSGFASMDVDADFVILALPFTVLRQVSTSAMGFSPLLSQAIRELGMGVNAKMHFQFNRAAWERLRSGDSLSDLTTGVTWPGHPGLPGSQALIVCMNSSQYATQYADSAPHGAAPQWVVNSHLSALEQILPGARNAFNGDAYLDYWTADPWARGSYSYYRPGQFTRFAGVENKIQGRVFFAGEHTAPYEFRGLMNGAVVSGERAAQEVFQRIG